MTSYMARIEREVLVTTIIMTSPQDCTERYRPKREQEDRFVMKRLLMVG